jgi:late competence protein required for DNA uptake (superfamily II DNA/RNA helicase)|tara:strand:- start:6261 stop:6446 length:186 start_codon:yes stop_codon:yes gene_type:complete
MSWEDILKDDERYFCERCKEENFRRDEMYRVKDLYGRDVKVCEQCAAELDELRNKEEKDGE